MTGTQQTVDNFEQMKTAITQYHQKQDQKMNALWAAVSDRLTPAAKPTAMSPVTGLGFKKSHPDWQMKADTRQDLRHFMKTGLSTKALVSDKETGAYVMPYPVQEQMNQALMCLGSVRSLARVAVISQDSLDILIDAQEGDVGWVAEAEARPETTAPMLEKKHIAVHEMYAKPLVSQKVLDDAAINVEAWLMDRIVGTMMRLENACFVSGDGVGKPMGFLHNPRENGVEVIKSGMDGGLANMDVLYHMLESLQSCYLQGAVWYMARSVMTHIRCLKTSDGLPLWQPAMMNDDYDRLLGYPIVLSDDMPKVQEGRPSHSLVLANFKQGYQIVDRHDMGLLRDPYSSKPFVEFYVTKRVGGGVVDPKAFKILSFEA